jgi:hypothetical protein
MIPRLLLPGLVVALACARAPDGDPAGPRAVANEATGASGPTRFAVPPVASPVVPPVVPPVASPVVPPEPVMLHGRNLAKLPAKVAGVPRVLFVGDSVATGFGLPEDAPP